MERIRFWTYDSLFEITDNCSLYSKDGYPVGRYLYSCFCFHIYSKVLLCVKLLLMLDRYTKKKSICSEEWIGGSYYVHLLHIPSSQCVLCGYYCWYSYFYLLTLRFYFQCIGSVDSQSTFYCQPFSQFSSKTSSVFHELYYCWRTQYAIRSNITNAGEYIMELLRLIDFILARIKIFFAQTEKEKRDAEKPEPFEYFNLPARQLLAFTIVFIYSTIAPIVLFLFFLTFPIDYSLGNDLLCNLLYVCKIQLHLRSRASLHGNSNDEAGEFQSSSNRE